MTEYTTRYAIRAEAFYTEEQQLGAHEKSLRKNTKTAAKPLIRMLKGVNMFLRVDRLVEYRKGLDNSAAETVIEREIIQGLHISEKGQKIRDDKGCLLELQEEYFTDGIQAQIAEYGFTYSSFCGASIIAQELQSKVIDPYVNSVEESEEKALEKLTALETFLKQDVLHHCNIQGGRKFITDLGEKIERLLRIWRTDEPSKIYLARQTAKGGLDVIKDFYSGDYENLSDAILAAESSIPNTENVVMKDNNENTEEMVTTKKILGLSTLGIETIVLMLLYPLCRNENIMQNNVHKWYSIKSATNTAVELEIKANDFLRYTKQTVSDENRRKLETILLKLSNTTFRMVTKNQVCGGSFIYFKATNDKTKTGSSGVVWRVILYNDLYQFLFDKANTPDGGYIGIISDMFSYIMENSKSIRTVNLLGNSVFNYSLRLTDGEKIENEPLKIIMPNEKLSKQQAERLKNALMLGDDDAEISIDLKNKTFSGVYPSKYREVAAKRQKIKLKGQ